jgi:hypothetical protein
MSSVMPAISAATTGAVVAAHQQQMMAEEERMATYTQEELAQEWEFKIVRSYGRAFRNPKALQKLLQEEAVAGWRMVEKFDDSRVRFKRPRTAREQDPFLPAGVDPYRTHYGTSGVFYAALAVGFVLAVALGLVLVLLTL